MSRTRRNTEGMAKDIRVRPLSSDGSRKSPYPCSSKNIDPCKPESYLLPVGDEKEWEEARCPICIEQPHNAVLLLCSSRDKGCRPYMCDTSYRHSNCLDQFCKSSGEFSSKDYQRESAELTSSSRNRYRGKQLPKLMCPLCRGQVSGWIVIEPARQFMNSKQRNCSLETCDFGGNYSELRKHARLEHPSVFPSEADPERQRDWTRMERERNFEDFLSAFQQNPVDESSELGIFSDRDLMGMEHERDLDGILDAIESEPDNDWNDDWLMNLVLDLPFASLPVLFPFEPWTSDFGSSGNGGPSGNGISLMYRPTYNSETVIAARRGSDFSRGNSPSLQQQQQRRSNHRDAFPAARRGSNFSRGSSPGFQQPRRSNHRETFPAARRGSGFPRGSSPGLQQGRRPNLRQSRPNH